MGFVNHDSKFESIVIEGTVDTNVVVACFDWFAKNIQKLTFVPIDNASVHTSYKFLDNIERWREMGLIVVPIAPYSPELNIIEMVWQKIKLEFFSRPMQLAFYKGYALIIRIQQI